MTLFRRGSGSGWLARGAGLLALVLASLCIAFTLGPAVSQDAKQAKPAVPVEAAKVEVGELSERVTAVGSLRSNESVIIRPEIAGRVVSINFDEGQRVKTGDLLIALDDSVYSAELDQSKAQLQLAERNFKRIEELHQREVATARARDEAQSGLSVGNASVALAQARLAKTRIVAPFSGIAGLRHVSVGDYINVGQDIVNLEDIEPLKADFRIAEKFLSAVRTGQRIQIGVDAYPGETFEGEVYAIDPRIDESGRSIVIRARVPNEDGRLRPGLFARVTLILEMKEKAITVPEQAIMPRGDEQFVYTVVDGKVKQTKVTIGTRRDGRVEIVDGLGSEDTVVTAGHLKIRDGVQVTVVADNKGV